MNGENVIIIPARLDSTRLPGKVLLKESGKYLLQHVYEQAVRSKEKDMVLVATDSQEVIDACKEFGANCVLTSRQHNSGTDRACEVVRNLNVKRVVNVQADEPFIDPTDIDNLFSFLENHDCDLVTLCAELDNEDEDNENVVKVYIDPCGKYAVTFSRHILKEGVSDLFLERHVGVYGYTKNGLLTFASMPQSEREKSQRLEQLRWLDDGLDIAVISSVGRSLGIDTRDDYDNFLAQLEKGQQ